MQVIYDIGNVWALHCFGSRRRRFRSVWKLIGTLRVWWNWQTRKIQVLITAMLCRFKSCHPHQTRIKRTLTKSRGGVLFFFLYPFCDRTWWGEEKHASAFVCLRIPIIQKSYQTNQTALYGCLPGRRAKRQVLSPAPFWHTQKERIKLRCVCLFLCKTGVNCRFRGNLPFLLFLRSSP